ncbi:MAG TPA: flagellar biosynthesis protein FlhB [Dissulfurispiraceae bacterium]|nr:flagellar biosynthesis protein FlhB [Dissulfurispiraceae bacterium]
MPEQFEERTEQATPRRREKAREKGDVPKSRELTSLFPVWTIFLFMLFGGTMFTSLLTYFSNSLRRGITLRLTESTLIDVFRADTMQLGLIMLPLFVIIFVGVMVVHFLQTGFLITSTPLTPDLTKLDPLQGIKRLFSINTLYETVKGLLKVAVLGAILYFMLKKEVFTIPLLVDMDIRNIIEFSFGQIKKIVMISALVLTVFAAADYAFQRWQYSRNLKMTKQEVKEEYKEVEGSPLIKARLKSIQRELARRRMMQEVPRADVVITNPTHYAVALKYESGKMGAPKVVAKGANLIAAKIREIAGSSGVPVIEDKPLARALYSAIDVNQEIPEAFYKAVAAILAEVYRLKGRRV